MVVGNLQLEENGLPLCPQGPLMHFSMRVEKPHGHTVLPVSRTIYGVRDMNMGSFRTTSIMWCVRWIQYRGT